MGSSRPTDRSIGEATFLPQWMKGKLETRFDYSENTFSPPADDTFFYIRYPKYQQSSSTSSSTVDTTVASDGNTSSLTSKLLGFQTSQDTGPKIIVANKPAVVSQFPTETTTESAGSAGGRSIVSVASQIISFGKFTSNEKSEQQAAPPEQRQRKFSKSLPASPLATPTGTPDSSPKSRRRVYNNRFFTGTFVPPEDTQKNSWLLGSILGQSRELATASAKIAQEDEDELPPPRALARKKSISSQNLSYLGTKDLLQAKPSELREMNFWSPTSM